MNWLKTPALAFGFALAASSSCMGAATPTCSAWANTMGIASALGGSAAVISTQLSNGASFVFWASSSQEVVAVLVDEEGWKELTDWDEDESGTAALKHQDDQTCTIACDGNGGITVTIEGAGFTTLTWHVKSSGDVTMPANVCGCSGSSGFPPTQNVVCDATNCANTAACRPNNAGYCQNGTAPN